MCGLGWRVCGSRVGSLWSWFETVWVLCRECVVLVGEYVGLRWRVCGSCVGSVWSWLESVWV